MHFEGPVRLRTYRHFEQAPNSTVNLCGLCAGKKLRTTSVAHTSDPRAATCHQMFTGRMLCCRLVTLAYTLHHNSPRIHNLLLHDMLRASRFRVTKLDKSDLLHMDSAWTF